MITNQLIFCDESDCIAVNQCFVSSIDQSLQQRIQILKSIQIFNTIVLVGSEAYFKAFLKLFNRHQKSSIVTDETER